MPNYDFVCRECNFYFEKMVPLADRNNPQECPECHREIAVKTYITPPHGVVLTTAESAAKRAGLDPMGRRRAEHVRNKRKKDSGASEMANKTNEYWVPGHTYGEGGSDSLKEV